MEFLAGIKIFFSRIKLTINYIFKNIKIGISRHKLNYNKIYNYFIMLNNNLELKNVLSSVYKTKLYDKEYKYYAINLKKGKSIKFKTINVGTIIPLSFR